MDYLLCPLPAESLPNAWIPRWVVQQGLLGLAACCGRSTPAWGGSQGSSLLRQLPMNGAAALLAGAQCGAQPHGLARQ